MKTVFSFQFSVLSFARGDFAVLVFDVSRANDERILVKSFDDATGFMYQVVTTLAR